MIALCPPLWECWNAMHARVFMKCVFSVRPTMFFPVIVAAVLLPSMSYHCLDPFRSPIGALPRLGASGRVGRDAAIPRHGSGPRVRVVCRRRFSGDFSITTVTAGRRRLCTYSPERSCRQNCFLQRRKEAAVTSPSPAPRCGARDRCCFRRPS